MPPLFWLSARITLGLTRPKHPIYGMELDGEVEAVGKDVTRFKVGDPMFASTMAMNYGAYAEYKGLPEVGLVLTKLKNMPYEQAATVLIVASAALRLLRKGNIQGGYKVLFYSASGFVGTYAMQCTRYLGSIVIGVCGVTSLEIKKSLGADQVIDYTNDDFPRAVRFMTPSSIRSENARKRNTQSPQPEGTAGTIAKLYTSLSLEELILKGLHYRTINPTSLTRALNSTPKSYLSIFSLILYCR